MYMYAHNHRALCTVNEQTVGTLCKTTIEEIPGGHSILNMHDIVDGGGGGGHLQEEGVND